MKIYPFSRLSMFFTIISAAVCIGGCYSDPDMKSFREEIRREDAITNKEIKDDLDDDLNPVERREVDAILEKNAKAKQRMDENVFGDKPKQ